VTNPFDVEKRDQEEGGGNQEKDELTHES